MEPNTTNIPINAAGQGVSRTLPLRPARANEEPVPERKLQGRPLMRAMSTMGAARPALQIRRIASLVLTAIAWDDKAATEVQTESVEVYRSLGQTISRLRWMTIVMLFLITMIQPRLGQSGLTNWELLIVFAGYNFTVDLAFSRLPVKRALLWRGLLDLPAAGLIYLGGARPGSPQADLIFMAVLCAALSMPLRWSLIYTAAAIIIIAFVEPSLPLWSYDTDAVRELGGRMALLAFSGTGTAIMYRRLTIERAESKSAREEAARLNTLDKMREDFISSITHDLRTPFTAIRAGLGMVEMSMNDRLKPEEVHLLGNVRRNSDRLGILINDLVAFTQVEAGALRFDMRAVNVAEIATNAANALQPLAHEKGQMLDINMGAPLLHKGDSRKLEQVFTNLIDNAHRHTPRGTHIAISGRATDSEVIVEIRDNGPGIPPQECAAIFERFHRIDIEEGGWGLGLTIAQAFTEKHGGRIWVESEIGQGCAFFVALPRLSEILVGQEEDQ